MCIRDRYYRAVGVYPTRVDYGGIDHNASDFVKIDVTFALDKIYKLPKDVHDKWRGAKAGDGKYPIDLSAWASLPLGLEKTTNAAKKVLNNIFRNLGL